MTKTLFLKTEAVQIFTDFLVNCWYGNFPFRLSIYRKGKMIEFKELMSIQEAVYPHYLWEYAIKTKHALPKVIKSRGYSYQESSEVLAYCKEMICRNGNINMSEDLKIGLELILSWGGVFKKGNKIFVEGAVNDIHDYLKSIAEIWKGLNQGDDLEEFDTPVKCNAGFTKIYSLLLDEFIIYDSRVAVAIAFLLEKCFADQIPEIFKLYIPPSQVVDKTKRALSGFFDKNVYKPDKRYFVSNVKASWILQEVARKLDNRSSVREIEAALFMIGYDIRSSDYKTNLVAKK